MLLIPFGGLGHFGSNMMGIYIEQGLYIVDCGVTFPDQRKLGVDAIAPDVMDFIEQLGGIQAYFITHGHEDHIGALPVFYPHFPAPIFATSWTKRLIEEKFAKYGHERFPGVTEVRYGDQISYDSLTVEWIHMTHSLPEGSSLFIQTPAGTIFHSGDFKIDAKPVIGDLCDKKRLGEIGKIGVDYLLCDSTNAHKEGRTGTEHSVETPLTKVIKDTKGRVFLSCFSSNVARIQTIMNACQRAGRKLTLAGRSLEFAYHMGLEFDYITENQEVVCDIEEGLYLERKKSCFLLTGSQAEYRGSLARLVYGEFKGLHIEPGDVIVLSSRIIPGNEKAVLNMMNEAEKQGASVISNYTNPDIHVSGHAHSEEILELAKILQPKTFIPVHGTFMHLDANRALGNSLAKTELAEPIFNGDIVSVKGGGKLEVKHNLEFEVLFVDAFSKSIMTKDILRQRLKIGEHGLVILSGSLDAQKKKWREDLEITFQGLGPAREMTMDEVRKSLAKQLNAVAKKDITPAKDQDDARELFRVTARRELYRLYGRKPVVLSLINL